MREAKGTDLDPMAAGQGEQSSESRASGNLRAGLKGMSYQEQMAALSPAEPAEAGSESEAILKQIAGDPRKLRVLLASRPSLVERIEEWTARGAGGGDVLNTLMGRAFPGAKGESRGEEKQQGPDTEKNPDDPTIPLPSDRAGNKALTKGTMKWTLKAVNHSKASVEVDFKPKADKVEAKNVSFVQTVVSKLGSNLTYAGTTSTDAVGKKTTYQPFEESTSKKRVDHIAPSENDPFYGAEWDETNCKWKKETSSWAVGSSGSGSSTSAKMTDGPSKAPIRVGNGDFKIEFETVPVVLETREPLGALKWGWSCEDKTNAPIVLEGGKDEDCTDSPSSGFEATQEQFYKGKFKEILDSFDANKWDLSSGHKTQLDSIVSAMNSDSSLRAQLGGAADLSETSPADVSKKRAEAARDYLKSKGIDQSRLEIQHYGADWAKEKTSAGKDEPKNRRVQVWLH